MDTNFLGSLAIGITLTGLLYAAAIRVVPDSGSRRALGVVSGALGFVMFLWLDMNPGLLDSIASQIVEQGALIILAFLGMVLLFWRTRK